MEAGRSVPTGSQPSRFSKLPARRFHRIIAWAVLLFGIAIGSYYLGRLTATREEKAANVRIVQLESEVQKLTANITRPSKTIEDLEAKLKGIQTKLTAIMPSENIYNVSPNQSLIVANGRLTIGLIGSPMNDSINININGKRQLAATGDIIKVAVDPSTTCQVGVQSFDMFKAILTASCAAVKSQ
jgi:hypothetical protein